MPVLGRLWGRRSRRPRTLDADAVVELDGIRYDGRAMTRPQRRGGVWSGWAGRIRRAFTGSAGATESRAITEVPWAVGGTLGSASVSQERALRMGPVFSAVRLIADHVSTLPIKAYRKAGAKRIARSGLPDLFWRLEEDGQLIPWLKRCVTSLMLRGNAYGLITARDALGFPLVIQWLDPSDVTCNDTNPWVPVWYWMGREIPREDLLHIPWFVVAGKAQGLSPIEAYALTTNTGLKAQEYGTTWFDNGGVPPGTFKNIRKEIDQNAANTISDRLLSAVKSRRPIVYGADWDFNPITVPPEQAQFIETMKMTATQIAAIYGLPPEMIGGSTGDPMTYKTEEQFQQRLNAAVRPLLVLLEAAFSSVLPRFEQVKFNADAVARADLKTRYEAYEIAMRIGLLSEDEVRALEDLPPRPASPAAPRRGREARHLPGKHNQMTHGDATGKAAALVDKLKLASRIDLKPDETLVGSDRIRRSARANITNMGLMAVIDGPEGREVRLGIVFNEDTGKWRAANRGGTLSMTTEDVDRVVDELERLDVKVTERAKLMRKQIAEYDRLAAVADDPDRSPADRAEAEAKLDKLADVMGERDQIAAEGVVQAGRGGDLAYTAHLIDDGVGGRWDVAIGVRPKNAGPDWELDEEDSLELDKSTLNKMLTQLREARGPSGQSGDSGGRAHQAALYIRTRTDPFAARPLRAVS
jgi:HK97 family phage portal protein